VENGLGLTTITGLLTVVTSLTLSEQRGLTGLVLSNLVRSVLSTLGTLAVGVTGLGNVNLLLNVQFNNTGHFESIPPSLFFFFGDEKKKISIFYPSIHPFIHSSVHPSKIFQIQICHLNVPLLKPFNERESRLFAKLA
jgi:hypothetical protein